MGLLITGVLLTLLSNLVIRALDAGRKPSRQRSRVMHDLELLSKTPNDFYFRDDLQRNIEDQLHAYLNPEPRAWPRLPWDRGTESDSAEAVAERRSVRADRFVTVLALVAVFSGITTLIEIVPAESLDTPLALTLVSFVFPVLIGGLAGALGRRRPRSVPSRDATTIDETTPESSEGS